ncbi:hypothetical protein HDU89_000962 [Geranomyces variabilis]|nr:hypothetical protein HDU89_000962 [Geranomyces variabilis]
MSSIAAVRDYITMAAYDFQGPWDFDPNARGNPIPVHNTWTNVSNALSMATRVGVTTDKLVLGISTHGRAVKLTDQTCEGLSCDYEDPSKSNDGPKGNCSNVPGFHSFYEIDKIAIEFAADDDYDVDALTQTMRYFNPV